MTSPPDEDRMTHLAQAPTMQALHRREFVKGSMALCATALATSGFGLGGTNKDEGNKSHSKGISMEIKKVGSQPSAKGPAAWFTGTVRIDPLFTAPDPALVSGASVTFEPGARTAWHTHPLGQTLIVTAGCGWAQREGGPIEEIHAGDVVWFAPNERHWHGATPTTAMTHIAIQEKKDGKLVDWMEHVSDEQYRKR
jgi:quercetin dioxygenase-like cupin family protein